MAAPNRKDIPDPPVADTPQGTQRTDPPAGAAPPNPRDPRRQEARPVARRRPVGVTLVAALLAFNLIGSAMGLLGTLFGAAPMGGALIGYFAAMTVLLGVLLYGFWTFRPWGWAGTLALSALGVLFSLYQLVAFAGVGIAAGTVVGPIVGLAVLWYLTRPGVRALFTHKSRI